jgi:hypothetical protein
MLIQQQYYTSWSNPKTQRTGFQVKAESSNLTQAMTEILDRLIGYSIPTQIDASDLKNHPVALRYHTTDQIAVLVSSRSSGKDELGRDGNFFAHSLVGIPEQIAYPLAPIFYWDSPFWVSQDSSDQELLPQLDQLDIEIVFDFDEVWSFLDQGNRKQQFYQLLCAVIDYQHSKRRIVIVDDAESVALWIASICTFLPPSHCYFLSFSTYHHDPIRTPFIITGTTPDSYFRCTTDAYISYFILNAQEQMISEAPASDYAAYIAERCSAERYEEEVIDFFNWMERLDSKPQFIDHHLDQYVNFYQLSKGQAEYYDSSKLINATMFVSDAILNKAPLDQEDVADLRRACDLLATAILKESTAEISTEYSRSLRFLKVHDRYFSETFNRTFSVATEFVFMKQRQSADMLFQLIAELYSSDLIESEIVQTALLESWVQRLNENDMEQITNFWQFLGIKFHFKDITEAPIQKILYKTFMALESEVSNPYQLSEIAAKTIVWMRRAKHIPEEFLLKSAASYPGSQEFPILKLIYYDLVEHCSLRERRSNYWQYWQLLSQDTLREYEVRRDLLNSTHVQHLIKILEDWVNSLSGENQTILLNNAVRFIASPEFCQFSTVPISMQSLAVYLLAENTFVCKLDSTLYNEIFSAFASQLRICRVDGPMLNLYQNLLERLSDPTSSLGRLQTDWRHQIIIQGAIDLTQGILQESTIPQIHRYFSSMNREQYQQEIKVLLEEFFIGEIDPGSHFKIVRGVYTAPYREDFWAMYWLIFQTQLIDRGRVVEIGNILDLWFRSSGELIDHHPYVVPEFFSELPNLFETIQSAKNYGKIERSFKAELSRRDWYGCVKKHLQKSRKGFLGNLF